MRLNILTRKTLGGLQTDLSGRVLGQAGRASPVPGLFAAGEVAGFGGGGMHGYRSLEGSFLGGCLFSGREAGRALVASPRCDAQRGCGGSSHRGTCCVGSEPPCGGWLYPLQASVPCGGCWAPPPSVGWFGPRA